MRMRRPAAAGPAPAAGLCCATAVPLAPAASMGAATAPTAAVQRNCRRDTLAGPHAAQKHDGPALWCVMTSLPGAHAGLMHPALTRPLLVAVRVMLSLAPTTFQPDERVGPRPTRPA